MASSLKRNISRNLLIGNLLFGVTLTFIKKVRLAMKNRWVQKFASREQLFA